MMIDDILLINLLVFDVLVSEQISSKAEVSTSIKICKLSETILVLRSSDILLAKQPQALWLKAVFNASVKIPLEISASKDGKSH